MRKLTTLQGGRRLFLVMTISTLLGLAAAGMSTGTVSVLPPKLDLHAGQVAAASTQAMIDTGPSSIIHERAYLLPALTKRGEWLANLSASDPVVARIAKRVGLRPDEVAADVRSTANVPLALSEPDSERRASDIRLSSRKYRLEAQARESTPVLDIYTEAPTTKEAERLGDAAIAALRDELGRLAAKTGDGKPSWLRLRQLGPARAAVVNRGLLPAMAILTFVLTAAISAAGLRYLTRAPSRRAGAAAEDEEAETDSWPHTTRMVPWMFAGFLAVLWLLPFNEIQLTMKLPIDLKLDRLLLPFVALVWFTALAIGGRMAPRLRPTWIHAAIGAFLVFSFVSVILNARALNQSLELEESLKRLPLLVSYVFLFVIASTSIRRREVRAFMTYTLGLAVVCAIGVIWEYRFKVNLFFLFSDKALPGFFSIGDAKTLAVDDIGRRLVRGPAALPLEAVAMLSMALPIAFVKLMQADRWRARIWCALAACLLLAAMFATYRKSALLAPFSVIATMAYFRRRELLRLAPLALVLIVLVHVLAPGAIGGTTNQFDPSRLGVTTVSDRTADYDAIRPDVWTHLLFGRGAGSYDHVTYRILDSEFLHRMIEVGVVGLLAYVLMALAVVLTARRTIAARDPQSAPWALAGAASAVSFLVVSALFDVLSFPHPTYIFLYMAGLVTVIVDRRTAHERERHVRPAARHLEVVSQPTAAAVVGART